MNTYINMQKFQVLQKVCHLLCLLHHLHGCLYPAAGGRPVSDNHRQQR